MDATSSEVPVANASLPVRVASESPSRDAAADSVWVVVPAYNEERRLSDTLGLVCQHYRHLVVVDDGSQDGTADVAARYPVWVLRHAFNCGQGAALQTGIDFALHHGADCIVTFDADGQHDPGDIARLVEPVRRGTVDICLGSRFLGKAVDMPRSRWLILKLGVLTTRLLSWVRVTDTHNGLRALSREAARRIRITQNRMAHASEILDEIRRHGLRYGEAAVSIRYTAETLAKGQSPWNALRIVAQFLLGRALR
jgi:glycosyltransferase involved in cell wall biosynthesis